MPEPAVAPKVIRKNTNIIWFAMATPDKEFVPTWPIMKLSSRLTICDIPFWIIIGTAIFKTLL